MFRSIQSALTAAAFAVLAFVPGASAEESRYPFDMARQSPAALAAIQSVVPGELRRVSWIYELDGTAGPLERILVDGEVWTFGKVCQPHDCGENQFAFLVSPDGRRATGLIRSVNETGGRVRVLGKPTPGQQRTLLGALP